MTRSKDGRTKIFKVHDDIQKVESPSNMKILACSSLLE